MSITKIRKASIDDLNEVLTLFIGTIKNTCKEDYKPQQIEAWLRTAEKKMKLLINILFLLNRKII